LSDFYKIRRGEDIPGLYTHAKLHGCVFKIWAYRPRNRQKWQFFDIIFFQNRYIPYAIFLYKIWYAEGIPGPRLMPNFSVVTFKMWAYSSQNRQNWYFWYKFSQKRYIPLSDFLPNLAWGGSFWSVPSC